VDQIVDLYRKAPREVMQVWYSRSDAIANAAEEYKSIYEYLPPKTRRASARAFMANANAVNDALVQRIWPELPGRGFAQAFMKERWD
jgi:chromosome partitioning protein